MKNLTNYLLAAALFTSAPLLAHAAEQQPPAGQQTQPAPAQQNPPTAPRAGTARDSNDRMTGARAADEAGAGAPASSRSSQGPMFIEQQSEQQILASKLIGYSVTNLKNENVGKVNDLILDQNQRPMGMVISVGGFLGLGAKHVALPLSEIQVNRQNKIVQVNLSKEELNEAPSFTAQKQEPMKSEEESSAGPDMPDM